MMLFKLSFRNLRKSIRDYMIYFVTLIIGVAVFYVFNAMEDQTVLLKVSESTNEVIGLMNQVLSAISVFVSFVLGFLIVYASDFLLKRRKKEFGIYMLLGMGKRKISMLLFLETMLVGILSMAAGLAAGIVISQGMSVVVANLFEADMTEFSFLVSRSAIVKTMGYFLVIYSVVLLLNTVVIGRAKLIDLISAAKKSQKVRIRNPWVCCIVFLLASVILASAYYHVTADAKSLATTADVLFQIAKGCIGTFLVFWSLSGLFLFLAKRSKKLYYRNIHSFTVKELASRVNTTVVSGTIICLMLFVTICVLSSALSVKKSISDNLKEMTPVDITFYHIGSGELEEYPDIEQVFDNAKVDISLFKDVVDIKTYMGKSLTMKDTLGEHAQEIIGEDSENFAGDIWEEVIYVSDYNRMARLYGLTEYELADDEYVLVCNYDTMKVVRDEGLRKGASFVLGGKEYHSKFQECQDGFILMASNHDNFGFIVVPDEADVSGLGSGGNYYIANYNADNEAKKEAIEQLLLSKEFNRQLNPENKTWPYINILTRTEIYDNSIGLTAMVIFIGIYLGIIFMISGAAILALKQLSETSDSRGKYDILRRIGVDEGMLRHSLLQQSLLFFGMPLLLAVVHSVFGIQVCLYILETFGKTGILFSIVITGALIVGVYGIYFLVTYWCSRRIIGEK